MPLSANPAARSALSYITIGALMDVWSTIWFWYMRSADSQHRDPYWWYICAGVFFSGLVLMAIGFMVGRIGREARRADAPPAPAAESLRNATAAAASATNQAAMQANANGTPMIVVPATTMPGVMPASAMPMAAAPVGGRPPTVTTQPRDAK